MGSFHEWGSLVQLSPATLLLTCRLASGPAECTGGALSSVTPRSAAPHSVWMCLARMQFLSVARAASSSAQSRRHVLRQFGLPPAEELRRCYAGVCPSEKRAQMPVRCLVYLSTSYLVVASAQTPPRAHHIVLWREVPM